MLIINNLQRKRNIVKYVAFFIMCATMGIVIRKKYSPDYYNKTVHLTAKEIWKRDADKKALLESAGYTVEILWENA